MKSLLIILILISNQILAQSIIFVSGLYSRKGDLSPKQQAKLLNKKNVKVFKWNDWEMARLEFTKNPNQKIILFSKGCRFAQSISESVKDKKHLKNIFIVEPYTSDKETRLSVKRAVKLGVPEKNVVVGQIKERGFGVVDNPTKTPKDKSHFGAIQFVSETFLK